MRSLFDFVWLVPALPFAGSCLLGALLLLFNRTMNRLTKPVTAISIAFSGLATGLSVLVLKEGLNKEQLNEAIYKVSSLGGIQKIELGLLIDKFDLIMITVLTTVFIFFLIFFRQYMFRKEGYVRFFVYLGFFEATLLGLILSPNFLEACTFWFLSGILTYQFRYLFKTDIKIVKQNINKFNLDIVTDLSLVLGLIAIFVITNSFDYSDSLDLLSQSFIQGNITYFQLCMVAFFLLAAPVLRFIQFPSFIFGPEKSNITYNLTLLCHYFLTVIASIYLLVKFQPFVHILL